MDMSGGFQMLDGLGGRLLGGGGGGSPSVPSDISGLLFWYKADAITGITDGNPITTWPDSSGSGRDATPNAVNAIYRASVLNSKPVVEFQNDRLTFTSASLGTAHTVFLVIRPLAGFTDGVVLGGDANGKYTPYLDSTDIYYRAVSTDGFVSVAHGGLTTNTGYLLAVVRSGTSVSFYKNGSQLSTTQTLGANTALAVQQISGAGGGNFTLINMQIAELFGYDTALSTANRQAMETYSNGRWALF